MKFKFLFIIVFIASILNTDAKTAKDVFDSKQIVFYGADFSNAKFIGNEGFKDKRDIVGKFIPSLNELFFKEQKKYDLKKFFKKEDIVYNLDLMKSVNSKINPNNIVINQSFLFESGNIEKSISSYNLVEKDGIGLVLIVESLNKVADIGTFHVVFFDLQSKSILVSEKITGKPGGIGFRNYWAKVFFSGLKDCEGDFSKWQSKYAK